MERNYWLDSLRGFAAIWVVIFHLNEIIPFETNFYTSFAKYGWLGVPIFFILSGYCISMVTQKSTSPHEFMLRRIFRIFPPYYASIGVVLMVVLTRVICSGYNDVSPIPSTITEILATITLLTEPATEVGTMNWVYWSLTYEIVFYLIVALTLYRRSFSNYVFLLICILCFIPGTYETVGKTRGPAVVEGLFFLREWLLFGAGLGLYQFTNKKKSIGTLILLISFFGIAFTKDLAVGIVSLFTLISIYFSHSSLLSKKYWLSKVGEYSYSLYLIHVPIGVYLLLQFRKGIFLDNLILHILYDFIVLGILILISYWFYRLVEKPSILIGKAVIKRNISIIKGYYAR
ncbi:peptidoglycan/LPS O-acetylase OafA/YrhL [Catalinimonas alkaloidigena]|uniref:acyltransferase family protein n=1 Tax=Catalinimonas alkaloidigena TaxID=1075417 RepID=UPI002404EC23|nr:acyltransferase [Catalinimonas alkaloidigena]MDF9798362.1 peptidoglycan/LPS O-acetylase OafA/YrhL [Catalinimonas alkaloidigena]